MKKELLEFFPFLLNASRTVSKKQVTHQALDELKELRQQTVGKRQTKSVEKIQGQSSGVKKME